MKGTWTEILSLLTVTTSNIFVGLSFGKRPQTRPQPCVRRDTRVNQECWGDMWLLDHKYYYWEPWHTWWWWCLCKWTESQLPNVLPFPEPFSGKISPPLTSGLFISLNGFQWFLSYCLVLKFRSIIDVQVMKKVLERSNDIGRKKFSMYNSYWFNLDVLFEGMSVRGHSDFNMMTDGFGTKRLEFGPLNLKGFRILQFLSGFRYLVELRRNWYLKRDYLGVVKSYVVSFPICVLKWISVVRKFFRYDPRCTMWPLSSLHSPVSHELRLDIS